LLLPHPVLANSKNDMIQQSIRMDVFVPFLEVARR